MSPVVQDNEISSVSYLTTKIQSDIIQVLSNKNEALPKISYLSSQLSKESYDKVYKKIEELLAYIVELEHEEITLSIKQDPAVVFLSFYSPLDS